MNIKTLTEADIKELLKPKQYFVIMGGRNLGKRKFYAELEKKRIAQKKK